MTLDGAIAPAPLGAPKRCAVCGDSVGIPPGKRLPSAKRTRCDRCRNVHARSKRGEQIVHPSLPYSRDPAAQIFVAVFKDGATLADVAEAFGVSRERTRQIQDDALRKLARLLGRIETPAGERAVIEQMRRRAAADGEHESTVSAAEESREGQRT